MADEIKNLQEAESEVARLEKLNEAIAAELNENSAQDYASRAARQNAREAGDVAAEKDVSKQIAALANDRDALQDQAASFGMALSKAREALAAVRSDAPARLRASLNEIEARKSAIVQAAINQLPDAFLRLLYILEVLSPWAGMGLNPATTGGKDPINFMRILSTRFADDLQAFDFRRKLNEIDDGKFESALQDIEKQHGKYSDLRNELVKLSSDRAVQTDYLRELQALIPQAPAQPALANPKELSFVNSPAAELSEKFFRNN